MKNFVMLLDLGGMLATVFTKVLGYHYHNYYYSLSSAEQDFFNSIHVPQLCIIMRYFIEMIKDGYYNFYSLPIGMKKMLSEDDCKTLEKNLSSAELHGKLLNYHQ